MNPAGSGGPVAGARRGPGPRLLVPAVLGALILAQAAFLFLTSPKEPSAVTAIGSATDTDGVRLVSLSGDVRIEAAIGTRVGRDDDPFRDGERLITGANGRAEIELPDVGAILLDAESILERANTDGAGRDYYLRAGRMLVQIAPANAIKRPIIHTPHATFLAESDTENEFLVVAEP